MYWLETEVARGEGGFTIVVPEPRRPGLVLESSRSRRLRLSASGDPLLWARIEDDYAGVWVLRRETTESPAIVGPIRAREARARSTIGEWMRYFAGELERSARSPLSQGTWQLSELGRSPLPVGPAGSALPPADAYVATEPGGPPAAHRLLAAPSTPRLAFQPWRVSSPHEVFPLRSFSDLDASRVKAWRKHARDGTLPPILLWYVSGLEMPLLVDGHDRLRAALSENVAPRVLALWQSLQRPNRWSDDAWRARAVEGYERAHQGRYPLSDATRRGLNDALADAFRPSARHWITTGRAAPGLDELWRAEVSAELAGDPSDEAWNLLHDDAASFGAAR